MGPAIANPLIKVRVGRIFVRVTQEDIDRGVRNAASCCPVALAIKRMGFEAIHVWNSRTSFLDPQADEFIHRDLPPKAIAFVTAFDAKQPVKPTKFHI